MAVRRARRMANPAMMQQAQQMMASNPAMAQQAAEQMKNMSASDLKSHLNQAQSQLPAMAAAAPPVAAAAVSASAKLKGSAMAVPEEVIALVEQAEEAKAQGNTQFKAGEYAAAAAKYENGASLVAGATEKKPLSGGDAKAVAELKEACHLNLANCKLKLREWDAAAAVCTTVLERGENRKARFRRGDAYAQLGKLEEARADLAAAVKMDPSDTVVAEKLRAVESRLGVAPQPDARVEEVERVVEEIDTSSAASAKKAKTGGGGGSSSSGGGGGGGSSGAAPPAMPGLPPHMRDPEAMLDQLASAPEAKLEAFLDQMEPDMMEQQMKMVEGMSPAQLEAMGMPPGVSKEQLQAMSGMFKGMDKETMKSMAKMSAQMAPQMQAMHAGQGSASASSGGGSGASSSGGMPGMPGMGGMDLNDMSMDKGMDMLKNMNPDMMKAGMDMMKNMDPAMMKSMSKMMGRDIDEKQMEQMQSAMANMSADDMQKWANRAQSVAKYASGPVAAYKSCKAYAAKLGAVGALGVLGGLMAILMVGHYTETF